MFTTHVLASATLLSLALARTDLSGCTSTSEVSPAGASIAWYVPGTGEICAFLDCGGGAGAPLYNVPGCPLYTGTSTYSPSYMPGWGAPTASPAATSTTSTTAWPSASASSSEDASATAVTSATSTSAFPSVWTSAYAASAQPLICAFGTGSCTAGSTSTYGQPMNTTVVTKLSSTSMTQAAYVNGTTALTGSTSAVGIGSITSAASATASASGTSSTFTGAAAAITARAWAGSAGLVFGIGAVIAAL